MIWIVLQHDEQDFKTRCYSKSNCEALFDTIEEKKKDISKHSKILSCINGAFYNFHVMEKWLIARPLYLPVNTLFWAFQAGETRTNEMEKKRNGKY